MIRRTSLLFFTTICLICFEFSISQEISEEFLLLKKTESLQDLLRTAPEKMFEENRKIIKEARRLNLKEVELYAILNQYKFYRHKVDFENMLSSANLLLSKARSYETTIFESIAHINLFESYAFLHLENQAFSELQKAESLLQKTDPTDSLTINTKSYLYNAYSNYYSLTKNHLQRIRYTKLSMAVKDGFKDEDYKRKLRYIDHVNLSAIYMDAGIVDSAEYYAKRAQETDIYNLKDVKLLNYSTLSSIEISRKNYKDALFYLKEAEKITGYRNHINDLQFFTTLMEVYQKLDDEENTNKYRIKKDSLNLLIKENQNKSLHTILDEEKEKKDLNLFFWIFLGAVVAVSFSLFYFIYRRNKPQKIIRIETPIIMEENREIKQSEEYSRLLEMVKIKDPAFIIYFAEVFPDFIPKLVKNYPNIIKSDIEFCALFKLNVPTHEIANFKNITLKSVQNKKYNIRKKFEIPAGVDIYNWFGTF